METLALRAFIRDPKDRAKYLRSDGFIPAIYYGMKKENISLKISYQDFCKIYAQGGTNTVLDLNIDGNNPLKVLIHDLQMNPVRDTFDHVDFIHVDMTKKVTTSVPLQFTGTSLAVKDLGGVLTINKHEIEVRCLPENIPHSITVDISSIVDFHTSIHVSEISVPEGVEVMDSPELTVVSVTMVKEEVEEAPVVETAATTEVPVEGAEAPKGEESKQEAAS
ncbi:50S ribosomal protein L25 [Candidatus Peregrinibacteria bacterium]|nr:50S ribosomal protein L25 [Candidatus Peregrinibacteria bacterium]